MEIDGFTFFAQVVNFLILVGLLKRFLYGPILEAMDAREASLAARMEEAAQKQEDAAREAASYQALQATWEQQRTERLEGVREAAEAYRRELTQQAREEVAQVQAGWNEALRREQAAFLEALRRQAGIHVLATARRALHDLADVDVEAQIVRVFTERLLTLDDDVRRKLTEAIRASNGEEVVVRSAFELSARQQQRLTAALQEQVSSEAAPQFVTEGDMGAGIELKAGGWKLAWSLDHFLQALDERFATALEPGETVHQTDHQPTPR